MISDELQKSLNPAECALLVVDKQHGYIVRNDSQSNNVNADTTKLQTTVPKIDQFIVACRKLGVPVLWTQMIENEVQSPENIRSKIKIGGSGGLSVVKGEESYDFYGLRPTEDETVVEKSNYEAFTGTSLHNHLEQLDRKTLILVGGYTSRCILGTAFSGMSHGYTIIVPTDLVGVPEKFINEQPIALGIISSILGHTVTSSDLQNIWAESLN